MGNKLYVDLKNTQLEELLGFNLENQSPDFNNYLTTNPPQTQNDTQSAFSEGIDSQAFKNTKTKNYKNLKVWRFFESPDEKISSEAINLTKIKEERFLLSSAETYIILIIFKKELKDEGDEMAIFPNSLWGVVESSSNMTPRGLKYAFSASGGAESLESFLLSKRDFKNSEFKFLLFIWNGKNCAPLLKSHVLMKAFDLDKKLSSPVLLPYLYNGYAVESNKLVKYPVVNLNEIISNKFENLTEEPGTPSTESFINYHETVYLLQLLYPKKLGKKGKGLGSSANSGRRVDNNQVSSGRAGKRANAQALFVKFNKEILNSKSKMGYYDNFLSLENYLVPNSKRSQFSKENNSYYNNNNSSNFDNIETFSLRKRSRINQVKAEEEAKSVDDEQMKNLIAVGENDDINDQDSQRDLGEQEELEEEEIESSEYEEDDLNDDLFFQDVVTNRGIMSKLNPNYNNHINNAFNTSNSNNGSSVNPINSFRMNNNGIRIPNAIDINKINTNYNPLAKERKEDLTLSSSRNNNSSSGRFNNNNNNEIPSSANTNRDEEDSFNNNNNNNNNNLSSRNSIKNSSLALNSNTRNISKNSQSLNFENFIINENFSFNELEKANNNSYNNPNTGTNNNNIANSNNTNNNLNTSSSNLRSESASPNKSNKITSNSDSNSTNNLKSESNKLKINLNNAANKNNIIGKNEKEKGAAIKQIPKLNEIKIPKLIMGIQHKILNDDLISQRMSQQSEEEEKLDNLPDSVIKKSSDKIFTLKKLDIKNILENKNNNNNIRNIKGNFGNLESISNLKNDLEKLDISKINEDYNIRDSDRKHIVMDYFAKNVSEVLDGFLYLSNYTVAKNKEIVFEHKITHIINCAADYCQNHFLDEGIVYTNYYLKDHPLENIECIFYEVIDKIEKVKENNGRMLIHCNQGISRSVSLVIAYLIYSKKMNYDEAFTLVQEKRSISCPNLGFSIQLQNFFQRLYEGPENYRLNPKIFAIGSFQMEQPDKIVCRIMNEPFYEVRSDSLIKVFDKRGIFIVCTLDATYIWIGSRIYENVKKIYLNTARNYVNYLQKHEKASKKVIEVHEGQETPSFISIWLDDIQRKKYLESKKCRFSDIISDWNNWYRDVDFSQVEDSQRRNKSSSKRNTVVTKIRKSFFIYPSFENSEKMIDIEDLSETDFMVLCYENADESKFLVYAWKGTSVNLDEESYNDYIKKLKEEFFEADKTEKVKLIEEIPFSETDEFINLL